jgi:hypothetical protein
MTYPFVEIYDARDAKTYIAEQHGTNDPDSYSSSCCAILIYCILHMCYETTHFEVSKIDCHSLLYSFQRAAIQAVDSREAEDCLVYAIRGSLIEQSLSTRVYNSVMDRTGTEDRTSDRDVEDVEAMLRYALICLGSTLVILRSEPSSSSSAAASSSSSSLLSKDRPHHDSVHYGLLHPLLLRSQEILMACESCLMRLSVPTIDVEDFTTVVNSLELVDRKVEVVAVIKVLQRSIVQFCNACLYLTSDHRLHTSFAHEMWVHRSNIDNNEGSSSASSSCRLLSCYTIYKDHAFNDATRAVHLSTAGHVKDSHISSILQQLHDLYSTYLINMR